MIQNLWSTPVLHTKMPDDLRDAVTTRILLDYDVNNPPSEFGREDMILANPAEEIVQFKEQVVYKVFNDHLSQSLGKTIDEWSEYKMISWLTGIGKDYNINYHNHRGSQLSAVFYLLCDDEAKGGEIVFTDPRQNSNRGYDESFLPWFKHLILKPKSGDIVVFPSFLYHFVQTYRGNIRLAMPVDLFLYANN